MLTSYANPDAGRPREEEGSALVRGPRASPRSPCSQSFEFVVVFGRFNLILPASRHKSKSGRFFGKTRPITIELNARSFVRTTLCSQIDSRATILSLLLVVHQLDNKHQDRTNHEVVRCARHVLRRGSGLRARAEARPGSEQRSLQRHFVRAGG